MVKVQGAEKLEEQLRSLPDKVQRKVLHKAVNEASKPIITRAKSLVPKRRGYLARALGNIVKKSASRATSLVGAKPKYKRNGIRPARYLHLVEKGTSHSRAKPFLIPAYNASKFEAVRIIAEEIRDGIHKYV